MISILITDDDFNKISTIIHSIHMFMNEQVDIRQASNVQEAIELLQKNNFHLLITDLFMPLRNDEKPIEHGGEILIKEIYKNTNKVNTPIYIVGLTQFKNVQHNFSGIWKVWHYDANSEEWRNKLKELIHHINKINSKLVKEKKETLFVEGVTDKELLLLSLALFFPSYKDKLYIETIESGAGAHWVQRQLVIWSKNLFTVSKNIYLQAIGLFDSDVAGKEAIKELNKQIDSNSAESKTYSTIILNANYAKHLVPLYSKGLLLPLTIEEMVSIFCWEIAKEKGWLLKRKLSDELLSDPKEWDKTNHSLTDYIKTLSIPNELKIVIDHKMNSDYKMNFVNYIKSLNPSDQEKALISFKYLLQDIITKLKI